MRPPRYYVLNAKGEPVPVADVLTWARRFEDTDRRLAFDTVGRVEISTVFLGLDHSFGQGPPVLWETMIFGGPFDLEQRRYTSRAEALKGHAAEVSRVRRSQLRRAK